MRCLVRAGQRLAFLDALRGIASLAVAVFHIYAFSAIATHLTGIAPNWVDVLFKHGGLGVDVFFVISGIAIATSIAGALITWRYIGQFAVRRSIRLDPPYWATLALAAVILAIQHRPASFGRVLAHVAYLQMLVGEKNIVSVFWTLTYEVQFYLVLVIAVMVAQRFGKRVGWAIAIVPFLTSLLIPILGVETNGWFILWWYAFAIGVATLGMLSGRLPVAVWFCGIVLIAVTEPFVGSLNHIAVAMTALAIGLLGRGGALVRWTGGAVLQWLGRRSYSLYLIHFIGANIAKLLSPRITTPTEAVLVFALCLSISLGLAEVMYRVVEAPAHRLSRSVGELFRSRAPTITRVVGEPASDGSMA